MFLKYFNTTKRLLAGGSILFGLWLIFLLFAKTTNIAMLGVLLIPTMLVILSVYLKQESGTSELSLLSAKAKTYFTERLKKEPEQKITNHMLINLIGDNFAVKREQNNIQIELLKDSILSKNNSKNLTIMEKLFLNPFVFALTVLSVFILATTSISELAMLIPLVFITYIFYNELTPGTQFFLLSAAKQEELLVLLKKDPVLVISHSKLLDLKIKEKQDLKNKVIVTKQKEALNNPTGERPFTRISIKQILLSLVVVPMVFFAIPVEQFHLVWLVYFLMMAYFAAVLLFFNLTVDSSVLAKLNKEQADSLLTTLEKNGKINYRDLLFTLDKVKTDSTNDFKDCEPVVSYACVNKKQQEILEKLSLTPVDTQKPSIV